MITTASVSLSPIVVAFSGAENHVQQRISTKILTDRIKDKADLVSKIVTKVKSTSKKSGFNSKTQQSVDFRA
jgi:hypothetical protein